MSVEDVTDRLDKAGRDQLGVPTYGMVRAVNSDGTVTVELGRGEVNSVPAARSYWPRAIGDQVLVIDAKQGPVVLCALGVGMGITISNDPPPGGLGWEAVNVFARADGALWGDRVTSVTPPSGTVTAVASGLHVYRAGTWLRSGYAEQGDYSGWGNQTGLVTFAAGAFAAIAGLTPTAGSVTAHRRDTDHGAAAATPITLWRASVTGLPAATPALTAGSHSGGLLRRNETGTTPISPAWLAPFCAGSANALAIYTDVLAENVELDSLTLTITAT